VARVHSFSTSSQLHMHTCKHPPPPPHGGRACVSAVLFRRVMEGQGGGPSFNAHMQAYNSCASKHKCTQAPDHHQPPAPAQTWTQMHHTQSQRCKQATE
jgi:hypothetical protein